MHDDRFLVDLLNRRFDDLNARVDELKDDLKGMLNAHEQDDKERFTAISADLDSLKSARARLAGFIAGCVLVIQLAAEAVRTYLNK